MKTRKTTTPILLLIALLLVLTQAACGLGNVFGPKETPTPTLTNTPVPTATPTPIPGCSAEEMNSEAVQSMISLGEPQNDRYIISEALLGDETRSYNVLIPSALAGALMSDGMTLKDLEVPLCAQETRDMLVVCYDEMFAAVSGLTAVYLSDDFYDEHLPHLEAAKEACDAYYILVEEIPAE